MMLFAKNIFILFFGVSLLILDQVIKYLLFRISVVDGWFGISHFINSGFTFSVPLFSFLVFPLVVCILCFFIGWCFWSWKQLSIFQKYVSVMVVFGGISNILDRIIFGGVRDPIKIFYGFWNFADLFILIGIYFLFVSFLKNKNS